ncbi:MAG: hypothetical protein H8E44_39365 [Planctomycetes bacterium]|nr:hypothetical protein [Planctomycetota bacterium]MBL7042431.1 hypothetical protein [Pirellulaceae bacterium]
MKHEGNGDDHHSASIILPARGKFDEPSIPIRNMKSDKHHLALVKKPKIVLLSQGGVPSSLGRVWFSVAGENRTVRGLRLDERRIEASQLQVAAGYA